MLDTEFRSFLVTLIVDVGIFISCSIFYMGVHSRWFTSEAEKKEEQGTSPTITTPLVSTSMSSEPKELERSSDLKLYLTFLKILAALFGSMAIVGLLVILPIQRSLTAAYAPNGGHGRNVWEIRAASARGELHESWAETRLYILFGMVLLFTTFCTFATRYFHDVITACEENTLPSETERVAHHCIMVRNLHRRKTNPEFLLDILFGKERKTRQIKINDKVAGPYSDRYRSHLVQTSIVYNFETFYEAEGYYQSTSQKLERYQILESQKGPLEFFPGYGIIGSSARDIDHTNEELIYRQKVLGRLLRNSNDNRTQQSEPGAVSYIKDGGKQGLESAGVAFLVFLTPEVQHDVLHDPDVQRRALSNDLILCAAPPPGDVAWKNLHISGTHQQLRVVGFSVLLFLLSWILVCPVTVFDRLQYLIHEVDTELNHGSMIRLLLTGYLPPLVILGINSVVIPQCIWYAAKWERWWRKSERQRMVLHMNLVFMIINSMIIPLACFNSLQTLVEYLATTLPTQWNVALGGTFFFTSSGSLALRYMINSTFLSSTAQMLQIPQFITTKTLLACAVTEGDKFRACRKWSFDFGFWYAACLSAFFLCLSFSIVAPLILPCGCLFFIIKYYIDYKNFERGIVCVNMESQGALARAVVNYLWLGLAFYHFCMSGFFIVQGFKVLGGFLFFTSFAFTFYGLGATHVPQQPTTCTIHPNCNMMPKNAVKDIRLLETVYLHPWERARRENNNGCI